MNFFIIFKFFLLEVFIFLVFSICFELRAEEDITQINKSDLKEELIDETDTNLLFNSDSKENFNIQSDYEDEKISFGKLFEFFLDSQKNLINHSMISFGTGVSFNFLPDKVNVDNLPNSQTFSFEYGFLRLDSVHKLRSYSSEFVFVENNTNLFGIFKRNENEIYDNQFSFGAGLRSGLGINYSTQNNFEFYLLHSSAFIWTYFDYDSYNSPNLSSNNFFKSFDRQYKFGFKGAASAELRLSKNLIFDLEYEHTNIYSGMEYGKWLGSWATDIILQRWIDIFDPIFIKNLGYRYPFVKFFYKNSIAIILSEIRNSRQFFPFTSDYSLLQRKFIFRIRFIF